MTDILTALRAGLDVTPVAERPAGIEILQRLRPAAGAPVKPPTYEGPLEIHPRLLADLGETRDVIELDSVGSAANRIEDALLALHHAGEYPLPIASTTVAAGDGLPEIELTTLEMPHRVFDAWLRLSEDEEGKRFEDTPQGQELTLAHTRKLDALLETSAHDLLLGAWDSHRKGPHGQIRIARSLTTTLLGVLPRDTRSPEVVSATIARSKEGRDISPYVQQPVAARRDPLNLGESSELPKGVAKLSEKGLSSIPPQRTGRTVSIEEARYIGYLSFPSLRRLGFEAYDATEVRVMLALLGLYGLLLRSEEGWDLRAGAAFVPTGPMELSLARPAAEPEPLALDVTSARALLDEAVARVGVRDRTIALRAGKTLDGLVRAAITEAKKKEA